MKPLLIAAALGLSNHAFAECDTATLNKLLDSKFTADQVMQLCGKAASPETAPKPPKPAEAAKPASPKDGAANNTPAANGTPSAASADSAAQKKAQAEAAVPNDNYDWTGDRITFLTDVKDIKTADGTPHFAPQGAELKVSKEEKDTHKLHVRFTGETTCSGNCTARQTASDQPPVDTYSAYTVDKAAIENISHNRKGWTFGALIIPFKYQLLDRTFNGGSTIGPYLGYRIGWPEGTSTTFIASAGWSSNIAVPTAPNVTPAGTVNRSGFSTAVGLIFAVDKGTGIQVGVLAGQDRLGASATAPYKYEGKTWLSLSIGFKII